MNAAATRPPKITRVVYQSTKEKNISPTAYEERELELTRPFREPYFRLSTPIDGMLTVADGHAPGPIARDEIARIVELYRVLFELIKSF